MLLRFESPLSATYSYPEELFSEDFVFLGQVGTPNEGYDIEGNLSVTIENLLSTVIQFEIVLNIPDPIGFQDRGFY